MLRDLRSGRNMARTPSVYRITRARPFGKSSSEVERWRSIFCEGENPHRSEGLSQAASPSSVCLWLGDLALCIEVVGLMLVREL
jgi:hypothetical protein